MTQKNDLQVSRQNAALLLKAMPPRATGNFLDRDRLKLKHFEFSGASATVILAPTGFGKTAQLIQWRRDALANGDMAFWLTLDSRDNPLKLARGLAYSAQSACGKHGFNESFMQWIEECSNPQEAMTGWLAEVARLATNVLLLLDEADCLPSDSRNQTLSYLIGNAPSNLHIALAARPTSGLMASGALNTSTITRLTATDLRLQLDETITIISAARGAPCTPEDVVKLHELIEGWPLGAQLAAATLQRGGSLENLLSGGSSDIRRYFIDSFIDRQPTEAIYLLTRLANFTLIHPDLCLAIFNSDDLTQHLSRLQDETPLLVPAEDSEWSRLHPVAREVLHERFMQLAEEERRHIAQKASIWYAANNLFEEAAEQSYAVGNINEAIELVERNIRQIAMRGRNSVILAWYQRLSEDEIKQHPRFWAPLAWALSMSDQHKNALHYIDMILTQAQLSPQEHFEADLIAATLASYTDQLSMADELLTRWPEIPSEIYGHITAVYYVAKAMINLQYGLPEQARLNFSRLANYNREEIYSPMSFGFADYGTGLSHLFEGRYAIAEQELRPALARAEQLLGRRNSVTAMLAALFALACWESGKEESPTAILAERLIGLERHGLPDAVMAAYKALARVADNNGRQDQALNLLDSLRAIGQTRGVLRLEVFAQFEQIRLHAIHGRGDKSQLLCDQLAEQLEAQKSELAKPIRAWMDLHLELARSYATKANDALDQALIHANAAITLANNMKRGAYAVEANLLRADILQHQGIAEAAVVQAEAISLAEAEGMIQLLKDYPASKINTFANSPQYHNTDIRRETPPDSSLQSPSLGAGLLTPKEREVLTLLSNNLSNREVARAMDIGEQTVKWHVKNLFSKLDAGNRKHAVARARMLGLIDA